MDQLHNSPNHIQSKRTKNIAALGILLTIYYFAAKYLVYVFYYVSYAFYNGKVSLSWNEVLSYFTDRPQIIGSTSFQMSANISVSAVSVIFTLLIARFVFKFTVWSCFKPDKQAVKTGVKWISPCFVFNMISSTIIVFITGFLSTVGVYVPTADFSIHQPSLLAVIMQICYIIILAPLFEEIIYRGLVIKMLSPYSKSAAVLVSALAFGLMHGNIPQAVSSFCTGLIYAIIALKCNSIIPTIIIHSANNLIVNSPELASAMGIPYNSTVLSIIEICVGLFGFFVWFTDYKYVKYDDTPPSEQKTAAFRKAMTNPILLVYFSILLIFMFSSIIRANI